MKIFKIERNDDEPTYDIYLGAIVFASDENQPRNMNPLDGSPINWDLLDKNWDWVKSPDLVSVEYLGEAKINAEAGVILPDYKAG